MSEKSAEQQARDLLEQCGVEDAQSFTAGDVIALANLVSEHQRMKHFIRRGLAYGDQFKTPYAAGARAELRRMADMTPPAAAAGEQPR